MKTDSGGLTREKKGAEMLLGLRKPNLNPNDEICDFIIKEGIDQI